MPLKKDASRSSPQSLFAPFMTPEEFVERWSQSEASEQGNAQAFLIELCDLLGVGHPDPAQADTRTNDYVFERRVDYQVSRNGSSENGSSWNGDHGYIDLYKKGCFVLEAKQGSEIPQETETEALRR